MAAVYGALLPNLLGRDERSYYKTVLWYAMHASMPVLGHVGVSYEAQQGPGYYAPAALIQWIFRPFGTETAFHFVRALGVPLLVAIVVLAYRLAERLCPSSRSVPLLTAIIVGLNPHLLTLSGLVSNDLFGIAVAMAAVWLFTARLQDGTLGGWTAVAVGVLIGVSIIVKPSGLSLLAALPVTALVIRSRAAVISSLLMSAGVLLASGWWFVRNEVLYGDLTGINGLRRWGWPVHSGSLDTLHRIASLAKHFAVSYVSPQPTFGDGFRTPMAAKIAVALIALAALAGLVRRLLRRGQGIAVERTAFVTFALVLATSIGTNVYSYLTVLILDPRTTFASFFVIAAAAAVGLAALARDTHRALVAALLLVALLVADVAILDVAHGFPGRPLEPAVRSVETPP